MGNAVSGPAVRVQAGALDSYVAELGPDIHYDKSVGHSRFLKTVKANHKNGPLLIKIFVKPDPGLTVLRTYHHRLNAQRDALADIPNVYTYQAFAETDKAGYIIRQWLANNLFDRISTRPFLSQIEKKWVAFQILTGLRDARKKKIAHGSLSTTNILITSSNWVYITDFASNLKPTNLPLHDPDDFYYFFDSGGVNRGVCCVAPERFYDNGGEVEKLKQTLTTDLWKKDGVITEAMDVFSAGCVIAELFTEGGGMFKLSELFKYRESGGDLNKMPELEGRINAIKDPAIRTMVLQMIDLNPSLRPSFDSLLSSARGAAFPESFYEFYHGYVHSIQELPSPSPFAYTSHPSAPSVITTQASSLRPSHMTPATEGTSTPTSAHPSPTVFSASSQMTSFSQASTAMQTVVTSAATQDGRPGDARRGDPLPRDADRRIDIIWSDFERVVPFLNQELRAEGSQGPTDIWSTAHDLGRSDIKTLNDILPVEIDIPNLPSVLPGVRDKNSKAASQDGTALIILSLISSNIRSCLLPSSKLKALDLLLFLSCFLTDEAKLDRLIPFVVDLLHDDSAIVRASSVRAILQVLSLVSAITLSNASMIPEYILFNTKHLTADPDVMVRCIYAQCLVPLTDTSGLYLEMSQALKAHGGRRAADRTDVQDESYDTALADLQAPIQEQLVALLFDKASVVRRAILNNTSSLCIFLGRQKTNDVLLSHMLTYLNDRDWMLRYAFFQSIVDVAVCVGGKSLDSYILPMMIQALSDTEETVVAKVFQALTELSDLGLFQKIRIWELMSGALGVMYHPNIWIRQAAVSFLASAARKLPRTDVWSILYPSLKFFLRSDVKDLDEETILTCMKSPIPRQTFDAAVARARNGDRQFWKGAMVKPTLTGVETIKENRNALKQSTGMTPRGLATKLEEDEQQGVRTGDKETSDAVKLKAMKDYIEKLVDPGSSRLKARPEPKSEQEILLTGMETINLQRLGVVLHTVFIGSNTFSSRRPEGSRRSTITDTPRFTSPSVMSSPRMLPSDRKEGHQLDDLRKRLLAMDASTTSVHNTMPPGLKDRERRESTNSVQSGTGLHLTPVLDKSPPESVTSGGDGFASAFARRRHKIQLSSDGRAQPLVGSIRTNVAGLLETPSTLKVVQEDSTAPSGRSSPTSQAGTLRKEQRAGLLTLHTLSTSDGDAAIATLLEHLSQDTGKEAMRDFGPYIKEGPLRRRNNVRAPLHSRDSPGRKADITLVANLTAHTGPVNAIVVAPDHAFFVSCSDDNTVKVWDTAKLERNVTRKPRHVYRQHHDKVTALCMLENSHCFASAAADGSLHIVRVHITYSGAGVAKYGKISIVREHRVDHAGEFITSLLHYNSDSASNLIYGTSHGNIVIMDLRTMRILQGFSSPVQHGSITSMCLDRRRTWIVSGTLSGTLTLWDIRFGISLKSWKVAAAGSAGVNTRIYQCVAHPSNRQWIIVSSETHSSSHSDSGRVLVEVWDLEKTVVVETIVSREVSIPTRGQAATVVTSSSARTPLPVPQTPAEAIAALLASRGSQSTGKAPHIEPVIDEFTPPGDVWSLAVGLDFGSQGSSSVVKDGFVLTSGPGTSERRYKDTCFILMGSEDRKLRLWYLGQNQVERSLIISGVDPDAPAPSYSTIRSTLESVPTHTEIWSHFDSREMERQRIAARPSLISHHQQSTLRSHQDCITAIACIDSPFRGGVVSGDRSGIIKVYRVLDIDG